MEFVFFYNIFLFLLLSFSAYDCWQKPSTWKVCMLITVICLLPKGRFTLYKLLACTMLTVNRQPELYRVNQTLCDCKPQFRCKFSLYDTIRVLHGHLLRVPDTYDVKQKNKDNETIPSRSFPEQRTKRSFVIPQLCQRKFIITPMKRLSSYFFGFAVVFVVRPSLSNLLANIIYRST